MHPPLSVISINTKKICVYFATDGGADMFGTKYKINFTYDEKRIIVYSLVELKNKLIAEGRYTDAIDDLLIKFLDD